MKEGSPTDPDATAAASPERAARVELARDLAPDVIEDLSALAAAVFPGQPFSMQEEIARPWTRLWIACAEDDRPLSFLIGWHVADELHILNVATAEAARRRGFARALLVRALEYAALHHLRLLLLEVRRSNAPAIALYKAMGFSISGVRRRYYADNDEDAIEMLLVLDPVTGQVIPRPDEPI